MTTPFTGGGEHEMAGVGCDLDILVLVKTVASHASSAARIDMIREGV